MSILIYNISISGDCESRGEGSVYFDITGDTPPFGVVCTNPGCTLPSSGGTLFYSANGLTPGTYFLEVTDGASVSTQQAVYISSGTTATIDSQNTTCGLDDGVVTGFTSSVYGTSSFLLYDGDDNYITSGTSLDAYYQFQSLSAGTYYVVANDGGGCTGITSSVIINPSTPFTFGGYIVNDGGCIGINSGKIFITGLTPPNSAYTVNWTSNVNGQTGTTVTGLTEGVYIATITNENGCEVSESFTVQSVPPLVSAGFITINQPACFSNDGEVEFIVAGGTAPYFFSGSSGQVEITFDTSVTFTGLSSGMYGFLVTDAGLCTIYDSVNLQTPNSFSTVAINSTNSICSTNSGTINVIIDGGVTSESSILITVSGSTGTQQIGTLGSPNQTFYNLPNGDYIVMVETIGCSYTGQTSINSINLYTVTATTLGTTCGSNNGSLQVTPSSGGTLPYQYSLTGPTGNPTTDTNPTGNFSNLSGGNYILTVQDSGSPACVQTFPIFIDGSENVFFNMFPNQPLNGNDGSITTFITQGEPPFTYNWSPNVNGQTGSTVTGLSADTYTLSVTDASGCTLTKSVKLGGTKVYSDYRYYTICDEPFTNAGLVTKRGMRSMYLEGYNDLSSGDTNCVINSAIFSIYAEVGSQSAQTEFYTSTGDTDYPSDILWANTIKTTLEDFVGVSGVTVDIQTNRITITTNCEEVKTGCIISPINPLQDSIIKVNLLIDYDISCVSCS